MYNFSSLSFLSITIFHYTIRFTFTGGDIGSVICTAAEMIAGGEGSKGEDDKKESCDRVTTQLLEKVAEAHLKKNESSGHSILSSIFQ